MSYERKISEQAVKNRRSHTQKETAETFGVSVSAVKSWERQCKEKGHLEKKALERKGRKITNEKLQADIDKYLDDFNYERAKRFGCTAEGIRAALKRYSITRKKNDKIQRIVLGEAKGAVHDFAEQILMKLSEVSKTDSSEFVLRKTLQR